MKFFEFLDPWIFMTPQTPTGGMMGVMWHLKWVETEVEPLETNHYGCRLLVSCYRAGNTVYSGQLWLQSVKLHYCGQGGYFSPWDPQYTIAFHSSHDTSTHVYIYCTDGLLTKKLETAPVHESLTFFITFSLSLSLPTSLPPSLPPSNLLHCQMLVDRIAMYVHM